MYRELIKSLSKNIRHVRIHAPCDDDEIKITEEFIGYKLPAELVCLLRELDGDEWLILSAREMREITRLNREILKGAFDDEEEYEEKIDRHIFFAGNGCGDYYGYRVLPNGKTDESAIYMWEHECFEHHIVARDIRELICKYYNDEV